VLADPLPSSGHIRHIMYVTCGFGLLAVAAFNVPRNKALTQHNTSRITGKTNTRSSRTPKLKQVVNPRNQKQSGATA
jgi:hypothetical protein